jgi:hypothetical protein
VSKTDEGEEITRNTMETIASGARYMFDTSIVSTWRCSRSGLAGEGGLFRRLSGQPPYGVTKP